MQPKKRKPGRPKKAPADVRELFFKIRVSADELAAFVQAAERDNGGEVSTWARDILRKSAGMKPG